MANKKHKSLLHSFDLMKTNALSMPILVPIWPKIQKTVFDSTAAAATSFPDERIIPHHIVRPIVGFNCSIFLYCLRWLHAEYFEPPKLSLTQTCCCLRHTFPSLCKIPTRFVHLNFHFPKWLGEMEIRTTDYIKRKPQRRLSPLRNNNWENSRNLAAHR